MTADGAVVASATPSGRTTIAPLVVERIAAEAAREVVPAAPRATARLDGLLARLTLGVVAPYPAALRDVTRRVRAHVVETLARLAEVDAREVDIVVVGVDHEPPRRRRVR